MVPELVPEGDVPDLVGGILVGGDGDVAVQPEPVPVPTRHGGSSEVREPASGSWWASASVHSYSANRASKALSVAPPAAASTACTAAGRGVQGP